MKSLTKKCMSFDPAIQPLGIIKKSSDMLSEVSRIEKDKYCLISLTRRIYKSWIQGVRVEWWFLGAGGRCREQEDIDWRVQTSSYKITKFCGSHGDHSWWYCITYLKVAKKSRLEILSPQRRNGTHVMP